MQSHTNAGATVVGYLELIGLFSMCHCLADTCMLVIIIMGEGIS